MEQSAGHNQTAVFAAGGPARQRLVRALAVGGLGLLGAWLIALVLGVFGGVGSLPLLPQTSHPGRSSGASSADRRVSSPPAARREGAAKAQTPVASRGGSTVSGRHPSSTVRAAPRPVQQSTSSSATTTRGQGKGLTRTTTQVTGKPVGSPGNGPGGSGAPGQLR